jgi:hypothetical protein
MQYDLDQHSEALVWDCGECWSPAVIRGHIYVLKQDGVWLAPPGNNAGPVLSVTGGVLLLGPLDTQPDVALFLRASGQAGCPIQIQLADLTARKLLPAGESADYCLDSAAGLFSPGQVRGERVVLDDIDHRHIVLQPMQGNGQLLKMPDVTHRFSPVWIGDSALVYLSESIP